jgi:integrase
MTLHSYRYAWAERAKEAGYPERYAQEAPGHESLAVHRAYARKAKVKIPPLSDYEQNRGLLTETLETTEIVRINRAF